MSPNIILPAPPRPYANIQWGTQGALVSANVDIGQGVQLSIAGSTANVSVGLLENSPGSQPTSLIIAGMMSFSPIVKTNAATFTNYFDPLTGAAAIATRPPFAESVQFFRASPAAVSLTLLFQDANTVTAYEVDLAAGAQMTDPIPLTSDITRIEIFKSGGGVAVAARAIWNLGF